LSISFSLDVKANTMISRGAWHFRNDEPGSNFGERRTETDRGFVVA
jgi:hypothetical protein